MSINALTRKSSIFFLLILLMLACILC